MLNNILMAEYETLGLLPRKVHVVSYRVTCELEQILLDTKCT